MSCAASVAVLRSLAPKHLTSEVMSHNLWLEEQELVRQGPVAKVAPPLRPQSDIDAVRNQLSAPGWNRLMETRSRKSHADVDIYIMIDNNQAIGLALIASEPRQFTIVNIVGAIDLDKLHKLEGQFGVPKLDLDQSKPPAPPRK